ncbi:MAG: hypothetical protein IKV88_02435 [Clostridia bacterium]|nr:hypothetical protein [Clostridia bacterium]
MNTITDGCCIIDALCGIDTASPQVGQFSDNFTKIKFVIKKDLHDYNILLLTDTDGEVNFIAPDDSVLIKDTDSDTGETTLLWNIGREITSKSTVVIYQIVAYKGEIDNPESTWYSKEGRLTVTQSIDSSSKSASVIGTYPNLLTRLILNIEKCKENNDILSDKKVDKEDGYGLSENNFSHKLKEKLDNIEDGANVNVNPDWAETDESKDSYIKNKPLLSKVATSGSYEDLSDKPPILSEDDVINIHRYHNYPVLKAECDDEGNKIRLTYATLEQFNKIINGQTIVAKAELDDMGNKIRLTYATLEQIKKIINGQTIVAKAELDDMGNKIRLTYARKDELASVATSGNYNDLSDKPFSNVNWLDIDSLYGREKDGIYKVSGKEMSGTVGMGNSSSYMLVMTNVSGNVLQTCQYLIHSDGKSQYRLGTGTGIEDWSEWKLAGGSDINVVHNIDNISGDDEFDAIPSARAVKIHVGFVQNEIIGYIDRAIGDVETSLENIIAKYGLGGDGV